MDRAIEILTELSADELRALARKEDDRRAAMRMLAIANELDAAGRPRCGVNERASDTLAAEFPHYHEHEQLYGEIRVTTKDDKAPST